MVERIKGVEAAATDIWEGIGVKMAPNPARFAAFLDPNYRVREHLLVIGRAFAEAEAKRVDRIIITAPPQCGKPVWDGTLVLMADGSRRPISDIDVGDQVITHTGAARTVLAVHVQGEMPCIVITTAQGRRVLAAPDHPFLTPDGWTKAADLRIGTALAAVPMPRVEPPSSLCGEEARLLGMIVGDGCVSALGNGSFQCNITQFSPAVIEEIHRCATALGFTVRAYSTPGNFGLSGGARPWVERHGLARTTSHTKRVPPAVFTSPPEVIAEFVAGYWDCDGSVSYRGRDRTGAMRPDILAELYSVSRELLADVQHLLLRLGVRSTVRYKPAKYEGRRRPSWRLSIVTRDDLARFRSTVRLAHEVKSARLVGCPLGRTDFDRTLLADPVASVGDAGMLPCRCLSVAVDETFTADDLVVHNSETTARWGPLWWLARHPTDKVGLVSYGDSLAVKHSRVVRRRVMYHGSRLGLELLSGSSSAQDWELRSGGGMRAVGVESGFTGHPADIVLIDDPLKDRQDAESLKMRDMVWDCYSSTIIPRLSPRAPIIIVATRWHPDDLIGRVLVAEGSIADGGRWHVVHLPAIATHPDDPLGRELGEPLPHPKLAPGDRPGLMRHWQDKRATVTPRDWAALFQGDPRPVEGALIAAEAIARRRDFASTAAPVKSAVAVDPSGGGRDTAGIIGGYLADDGRLYWLADRTARMPSDQWARAACQLAHELDAETMIVESNYGGDMAKLVLRTAWQACARDAAAAGEEWGLPPLIRMVHSRRGKMLRAEPVAQQIMEDRIRLKTYLPELEHEWATWVVGADSPGRIDAAVHLAYALLPPPGATAVILNPNDVSPVPRGETLYTRLRIAR